MVKKYNYKKRALAVQICIITMLAMVASLIPLSGAQAIKAYAETEKLSVDPTGQGDGYSAVLYDNMSGLPTSEANAIVETQEGFIWIGSYSGLIRYDGNSFERIDSTTGIASVVSLCADSKNRLWIGTNDSGAGVMENGRLRMYNKNDGLSSLSVRSIVEGSDGCIYLATTHGLAYVDDSMELSLIDEPQIKEEYIRMLRVSGDTIYGVTINGAVFTLKNKKLTAFYDAKKLGIADIHSILPDPEHEGYVYIGNKGSQLYYGDITNGFKLPKTINIEPLNYINSINIIGGMVWVCTDSGIGFIQDNVFTPIYNVPMTTSIEGMMTDYQNNLWFVSTQQGVMKIVPNRFTDIFDKYHIEDEVVYSTCVYNDIMFIGTKNSGLMALRGGEVLAGVPITKSVSASGRVYDDTDLLELLKGKRIRSIIRDSKNRVWFSTFSEQGLICFEEGKVIKYTTDDGMPSERVRAVYERSDGSIMAACTGGLVVINNNMVTDVYDEASGIINTEILTAAEKSNGDMVIGTDGGGIYIVNHNGVTHLGTEAGLSSDVVMRIKPDLSRDILWIVTSNSIAYMDSDNTVHTIHQFPYSNNFDMYENTKGQMWVLSSNGIYVAEVEQLLKNEEITPLYYGMDNGLGCITTSNSYSELTEDGDLFISGTTGVAKVNIEHDFESVTDLKLAVPYIEADGVYYYPDQNGQFTVPSSIKKLTIYSYVYNYSLINPQVTYRLKGFEKNSTTVKRSELAGIDYTNLRAGKYDFIMQIQDPQGNGSKSLEVTIIKQEAVYERLWFKIAAIILALALIAGLVMFIINRRTKRFLKKEDEQKLLIREIVEAFAKVIDMKDKYTNGHSKRVAEYTEMLTKELGYDDETVEQYYNIALLHDIGKVGIPPEVLNKAGKLTDTEFNIIKSHSALGYNTLKNISIMPELAIGAQSHHERPDGKGYPKGLKGDEIPRVAQIIAVADTFDAMYSDRPYRKRMNFDKAVSILKEVRGTQLTSDVVDAFLRLVDKGKFRDPNDDGGGTFDDIDNIHKRQKIESEQAPDKENKDNKDDQ